MAFDIAVDAGFPTAAVAGPRTRIVDVLARYRGRLRIGVVANLAGQTRGEVEEYIEDLVQQGYIGREEEYIWLTREGRGAA